MSMPCAAPGLCGKTFEADAEMMVCYLCLIKREIRNLDKEPTSPEPALPEPSELV